MARGRSPQAVAIGESAGGVAAWLGLLAVVLTGADEILTPAAMALRPPALDFWSTT